MKIICTRCPLGCVMNVTKQSGQLKVEGNSCKRGYEHAVSEVTNPLRTVTFAVKINDAEIACLPIKTLTPIPKDMIFQVLDVLKTLTVNAPVKIGDVIVKNICGTNADIIATADAKKAKEIKL